MNSLPRWSPASLVSVAALHASGAPVMMYAKRHHSLQRQGTPGDRNESRRMSYVDDAQCAGHDGDNTKEKHFCFSTALLIQVHCSQVLWYARPYSTKYAPLRPQSNAEASRRATRNCSTRLNQASLASRVIRKCRWQRPMRRWTRKQSKSCRNYALP